MHMADALVSPAVAGTMYAASAAVAGVSLKKISENKDNKKVAVMGVMGAFVFATQMINFTIPGTGSSGHLCGGVLLAALLGPYAGFIAMIGVLLTQALFFADGGMLALGCNVWNMAFYGCFVGAMLIWKPILKNGVNKTRIAIASIIGCIVTLQLGAFSVTIETLLSGITALPFQAFVVTMQPIHLAIGLVEGIITASVLCFIYEARPEMLWGVDKNLTLPEAKLSKGKLIGSIAVTSLIIGGVISLFASGNPDGLEWSMEKVAGTSELEASGSAHSAAEAIQGITSFLPDYAFKGSESIGGTIVSGVLGAVIVAALCVAILLIVKRKHKYH